jgi:chemotaxis protein MotB
MFASSRRHRHGGLEIWPGFVDALSTVLMVIIFVLMTFVVSQLYLTDALSGRDEALQSLTKKIESLTLKLSETELKNTEMTAKNADLEKVLEELRLSLAALSAQLSKEKIEKQETVAINQSLSQQIQTLQAQLAQIQKALESSETLLREKELSLKDVQLRLDQTMLEKMEEIKKLSLELGAIKTEQEKQKDHIAIGQFRSEFFAKLKQAIGDRKDIRIVGDRFVFQSELFFDIASAELNDEGKKQLDYLASALKEITEKISPSVMWILRVDGHTDQLPIHTQNFASNWELSSGRAIAVVKYLISKGINPERLVAAGFGEHQPLTKNNNKAELARNRRIEFKLDHR